MEVGPAPAQARPTMVAGQAPTQHVEPWRRATHQHNTPDDAGVQRTSTACLTAEEGHATARKSLCGPRPEVVSVHGTAKHRGGPCTSTAPATMVAGPTWAQYVRPKRWAKQKHSTPSHGAGCSSSTAHLTLVVGQASAPNTGKPKGWRTTRARVTGLSIPAQHDQRNRNSR